jgi:aspartyl-tRNA(Asn)/glutamyl-tRNA(Gln) amidotransferase subunit C
VPITRAEVLKIADLAKLEFDASELEAFTMQFQHILDYIEKLKEVSVEGVEPTSHVSSTAGFENQMLRPDLPRPSLSAEVALQNAPDRGDGHFRVPSVI